MRERGWVEGQNLTIEARTGDGRREHLSDLAGELVGLNLDVIVTGGTPATYAVKDRTSTIPIVAGHGIPRTSELISSLSRPGGNVTGLGSMPELYGKRLELLKGAVPATSRVGIVWEPVAPGSVGMYTATVVSAQALGVQLQSMEVDGSSDLDRIFEAASRDAVDALIVLVGPITLANVVRVVTLAAQHRLPAMYDQQEYVDAGGLMLYAPSIVDAHRRAAYYVDRILKGARPADLPVEQPMTFDFVVNTKTARELGLTFPNEIMLQVTEVIQ